MMNPDTATEITTSRIQDPSPEPDPEPEPDSGSPAGAGSAAATPSGVAPVATVSTPSPCSCATVRFRNTLSPGSPDKSAPPHVRRPGPARAPRLVFSFATFLTPAPSTRPHDPPLLRL